MLLEIYKLMTETAEKISLPKYAEFTIGINKEESESFWSEERFKKEREILFDEFDLIGESKYTKVLYGIRFAIQFTYTK
jgi:hypothetical protein